MSLQVRATSRAVKEIGRLPVDVRRRVESAIDSLSDAPFRGVQLKGGRRVRRLRVGAYRILYHVDDQVVSVVRVDHRSRVYRDV